MGTNRQFVRKRVGEVADEKMEGVVEQRGRWRGDLGVITRFGPDARVWLNVSRSAKTCPA